MLRGNLGTSEADVAELQIPGMCGGGAAPPNAHKAAKPKSKGLKPGAAAKSPQQQGKSLLIKSGALLTDLTALEMKLGEQFLT
jgi:hypothetical protein